MKTFFQGLSLLAVTLCLMVPKSADAGFQVTLSANGFASTIVDNAAGDLDATSGSMIITAFEIGGAGTSGVFVSMSFDTTNSPGGVTASIVSNSSIHGTLNAGSAFELLVNATGFENPVSPPDLNALQTSTYNPKPGGNREVMVMFDSFYDTSNTASTTLATVGTPIMSVHETTTGSYQDDSSALIGPVTITPYALNLYLSIVASNGLSFNLGTGLTDTTAINSTLFISHVPEPTSMAIMGLGTLLAGFGVRRRKQKQAALAA